MPKWELLFLTQPSRRNFINQLFEELIRQGTTHRYDYIVVKQKLFDSSMTLGENRNAMLQDSDAEYVSFFDDDDWPAPNFLETIYPLLDGVDYVGFRVQCYLAQHEFIPYGTTIHSLAYSSLPEPWSNEGGTFLRDIVHINPIRRELAIQAKFPAKNFGEDHGWANELRSKGIVKTEHFVDEIMYHYIWRAAKDDAFDYRDPRRLALLERIKEGAQKHHCPECAAARI